jgi:nitronate monooxygenase
MWHHTRVTQLLGIQYPIMQGPFGGGYSTPALTAAVSNEGGMGGYGAYTLSPEEIADVCGQIRALTARPFAVNLWVSDVDGQQYSAADYAALNTVYKPYFDELGLPLPEPPLPVASRFEQQAEMLLRQRPAVFSFVFGIPSPAILLECRKQGISTVGAATTLDEALALEEAGVDMIIASGFEAGGHRPSFLRPAADSLTGTFALVPQVADRVSVPVIAAGGIADGRGIAAALTLGADAVQIGTAFLACEESNAPAVHKAALFSGRAKHTALTEAATGRLGRGLANRLSGERTEHAPFPLQGSYLSTLRKAALEQGKTDMVTFWAGQAAPLIKHRRAKELFHDLAAQTERILGRRAG